MKSRNLRSTVLLAGAALFCFGFSTMAHAGEPLTFAGGYTTIFSNSDGEFGTGIYSRNINGAPSASGIISDDYNDEVFDNETWNANAYRFSNRRASNTGETLFGNSFGLSDYSEIAVLDSMIFDNVSNFGMPHDITQSELSSAVWDIATPGSINGLDAKATALVASVTMIFGKSYASHRDLGNLNGLWVPTPNSHGYRGKPRETLITHLNVPEGGSPLLYLLLAGLSCLGALFVSRRKTQSAQ